jgi:hypothetical protein
MVQVAPNNAQEYKGQEAPALFKIFEYYQNAISDTNSALSQNENMKNQYNLLLKQYEIMRSKKDNTTVKLLESQTKWASFAKDILAISKELFKAIHNLEARKPVPKEFLEMTYARLQKYEMFLNESETAFKHNEAEEDKYEKIEEETLENEEISSSKLIPQAQMQIQNNNPSLAALDYKKIKYFLHTSKNDLKLCALLQALKWRLMRTRKGNSRKELMQWFITFDLMDCASPKDNLLENLLKHKNPKYLSKSCNK